MLIIKKDILIPGKDPTKVLDEKAEYLINFTESITKDYQRLH